MAVFHLKCSLAKGKDGGGGGGTAAESSGGSKAVWVGWGRISHEYTTAAGRKRKGRREEEEEGRDTFPAVMQSSRGCIPWEDDN